MSKREYFMDREVAKPLEDIVSKQRRAIDAWGTLTDAEKRQIFTRTTELLAEFVTKPKNWRTIAEHVNGLEIPDGDDED